MCKTNVHMIWTPVRCRSDTHKYRYNRKHCHCRCIGRQQPILHELGSGCFASTPGQREPPQGYIQQARSAAETAHRLFFVFFLFFLELEQNAPPAASHRPYHAGMDAAHAGRDAPPGQTSQHTVFPPSAVSRLAANEAALGRATKARDVMSLAAVNAIKKAEALRRTIDDQAAQLEKCAELSVQNAVLEDRLASLEVLLASLEDADKVRQQEAVIVTQANVHLRKRIGELKAQCDALQRLQHRDHAKPGTQTETDAVPAPGHPSGHAPGHGHMPATGHTHATGPVPARTYFTERIGKQLFQSLPTITGLPTEVLQAIGAAYVAADTSCADAGVAGGLVTAFGLAKECSTTMEGAIAVVAQQLRRIAIATRMDGRAGNAEHDADDDAGTLHWDDGAADLSDVLQLGYNSVQFTDNLLGEAWKALLAGLCGQAGSAVPASTLSALPLPAKAAQLLHTLSTCLPAAIDRLVQMVESLSAKLEKVTGKEECACTGYISGHEVGHTAQRAGVFAARQSTHTGI